MAWARPSSPVSTARSGRTIGSGRKRRSSRRSRGSSPARRNDDLPAPDGPRITNSDSTPVVRIPCSTSRPRRIWASRPKNTAASASSSGAQPRYGARSGSPGGGHGKCSAPIPRARKASSSRCKPTAGQHHRLPAIADLDFGGGAVVGEQVAALPLRGDVGVGHRLQPGDTRWSCSASRHSGTRSCTREEASQCLDSRQITASQRALACCSACFHRSPGRMPVCGSRSRKISSASPGSCSISHALTATAWRLSRLE